MSTKQSLVLSDKDLKLLYPITIVENLELAEEQKHIVIYIPVKYLKAHYEGLGDICDSVYNYNARARLTYLLAECVHDLATPKQIAKKKDKSVHFFMEGVQEQPQQVEETDPNNDELHKLFWFVDNNNYYTRMDVYFEVVYSCAGTIHGYRYILIQNDPKFSLMKQLKFKWDKVIDLKKMKEIPLDCEVSHDLDGVFGWVSKFLGPYLGVSNTSSSVYFMATSHEDSEANVYNALSFAKSCQPFVKPATELSDDNDADYICPQQCDPETYFDGNIWTKFYKKSPVTHIPIEQFTPHHLRITKFPSAKNLKNDLLKGETKERNLLEAKMKLEKAIYYMKYPNLKPPETERNLNDDDDFVVLKKQVDQAKEVWVKNIAPAKRKAWIRANLCLKKNNHILDMFNYIWNPSQNINAVMKNLVSWEQANVMKIKKYKLPPPVDCKKSPFLNMTAMMMKSYEDVGVIHMHSHLHLMFCVALGALHADNSGIHTHMAQAGPANAGKSYLMSLLVKLLMIIGTIKKIALITEKAFLTETDHSNLVVAFDEIDNRYAGVEIQNGKTVEGGNGSSIIKMALSNDISETKRTWINPNTGKSETITTIINQRCVYLANMNLAVYLMAKAIRERWMVINCANVTRNGRTLALVHLEEELSKHNTPDFFHLLMQLLVGKCFKLIETGIIDMPNIKCALVLFNDVLQKLATYGFITNKTRDLNRLENGAVMYTMWNALLIEYFMKTPEERFDVTKVDEKFLRVQDRMVCTEEIAIFTLTQMSFMFLDNTESEIMKHTITQHFTPQIDEQVYLHYSPAKAKYAKEMDILHMLAELVKKSMDKTSVSYSIEQIMNVYKTMLTRKFKIPGSNTFVEIMQVKEISGSIFISADYAEQIKKENYEELLIRTIKESVEHKYLTPKTVITGFTHSIDFPDVYKVLELRPNKKVKTLVNDHELREDIDEYIMRRHLQEQTGFYYTPLVEEEEDKENESDSESSTSSSSNSETSEEEEEEEEIEEVELSKDAIDQQKEEKFQTFWKKQFYNLPAPEKQYPAVILDSGRRKNLKTVSTFVDED